MTTHTNKGNLNTYTQRHTFLCAKWVHTTTIAVRCAAFAQCSVCMHVNNYCLQIFVYK